jgi:hypothetical protein
MEEHRLKPMQEGYDEKLFNKIYKETTSLRKKLAYNIDARKFGVDYHEVLSWFDVKFIFSFNKYYGQKDNDILKGYIIQSLQMFKHRISRMSYSKKSLINNKVEVSDFTEFENYIYEDEKTEDLFMDITLEYFKTQLTRDAFFLLQLQLNPPLYILDKLAEKEKFDINRISNDLILDYLDLEFKTSNYIDNLKKEIRRVTRSAKEYFNNKPLSIS